MALRALAALFVSSSLFIAGNCTPESASHKPISNIEPSSTFVLEGLVYFVPESVISRMEFPAHVRVNNIQAGGASQSLLTVFTAESSIIDSETLSLWATQYGNVDDVWSPAFLDTVALKTPANSTLTLDGYAWLSDHGVTQLLHTPDLHVSAAPQTNIARLPAEIPRDLNPGPYVMDIRGHHITFREVYRMWEDSLQAFTQGVVPVAGSTAFSAVSLYDSDTQALLVPVPSRLYSLHDTRPLAGLRMAVKDLYDVEGVKTSGGSRVYLEMYAEREKSAVAVTKLLELGAVAVGKSKTSQFAFGIEPWKWQDFKYPRNPRGDGWLEVAFSSSGSGAAIAGYDWLDFAMGSDTGGSVRMPAALGGSYGIRPTHGAMDLAGVLPLANPFDTAGIFARDPKLFASISRHWYGDGPSHADKTFASFPKKLLYPVDYFPLANPDAQAVFDTFIEALEEEFGMQKQTINVSSTLAKSKKPHVANAAKDMQDAFVKIVMWDSWTDIGKDLVARWNAAYPDAGFPPLDNETRSNYVQAKSYTTRGDYDEAVARTADFRAYVEETMMRPSDETCSESIMVLESGAGGLPSYREEFLNRQPGAGFLYMTDPKEWLCPLFISPLLSAPQISIPIGQVTYQSVISLQTEHVPVVIDLMAYNGCDGMLLSLVEALAEKGLVKAVKTGRTAF